MNLQSAGDSESRFAAYVERLVSVIDHSDRAGPLRDYCVGPVMPGERKSVEPMAAVTAPDRTAAQHQSLLHFVGQSPWSDEKVLAKVGEMVLPTSPTDRGVDRRRHRFSQEGDALGRRDATILWPGWQAGVMFGLNLCSVANIGHIYHLTICPLARHKYLQTIGRIAP
jgi:hypothetical protein